MIAHLKTRDVFEDNMVEAKPKAKATQFCPRGVLEVEASPGGLHPCHQAHEQGRLLV